MDDAAPGPLSTGQPREALVQEMRRALGVVPAGARVLAAVSGGPDSTAMAYLAAEARPDLDLVLAHVRHGLRDDRADVATVRRHASFLGAPLVVTEVDVVSSGEGVEAAARARRYAALRRIAREQESGWLLVGHTADDQAETVLLRLARGTGVPGLAAMAPVRGDVVRPLLRLRRSDVHGFVREEGLPHVQDPMNEDRSLRRVAARKDVLPAFEQLGPDPVAALARLADLARDDAHLLAAQADEISERIVRRCGPVHAVAWDDLTVLPRALAGRVVRRMIMACRLSDDPPTAAEVAAALGLGPGGAVDLPGVSATGAGGWLAVAPSDLPEPEPGVLPVPGELAWPVLGWRLTATTGPEVEHGRQLQLPLQGAWLAARPVAETLLPPGGDPELGEVVLGGEAWRRDAPVAAGSGAVAGSGTGTGSGAGAKGTLRVRPRQPGDRIELTVGTRKLSDVMIDAGVPRLLRELLPVLVAGDRILWIPGLAVDAAAAAAGRRAPALRLAVQGR